MRLPYQPIPSTTTLTEFNHDKIGVLDRSPPIPFDINSSASKITILSSPNNTAQKNALPAAATLNVEVTPKKLLTDLLSLIIPMPIPITITIPPLFFSTHQVQ